MRHQGLRQILLAGELNSNHFGDWCDCLSTVWWYFAGLHIVWVLAGGCASDPPSFFLAAGESHCCDVILPEKGFQRPSMLSKCEDAHVMMGDKMMMKES